MPAFTADLHNHTPVISGDYRGSIDTTAEEIVTAALDAGIDVFAVTDHFCWHSVPAVLEAATAVEKRTGRRLLVIPGTELRLRQGDDEAHVTALFSPDDYTSALRSLFEMLDVSLEGLCTEDLPRHAVEIDPMRVCRLIDALGGIAIVAHADRAFGAYRLSESELFERLLLEESVLAVDMLDQETGARLLSARNVSIIGCSDSHSLEEIGRRRALLAMPELSFEGLRHALARRASVHLGAIA